MFNWETPIVTNAKIQFGDTDVSGKGRHFKSRFIQPGVAGYPGQFGNVLITKENLDKFIDTMVGVPVRIKHGDNTTNDDRVGVVNSVWFDDKDGWYWCDGIIWDETAINLIKDKGWNVSCAYKIKEADNAGGTENNISYDMEFLDGVFDHLAIVDNPRYERAQIVLNAKELIENDNTSFFVIYNDSEQDLSDTSTDRWITIHPNGEDAKGRSVLIPEGKTVSEVMKEKYAKWATERKDQQKLFDTKQYKSGISDYKLEKKTDEAVKKYGEFADREQIKEHLKEKHNYKDYLKKDTKEENPTSLKKNETSEDFKKRILATEVTKYKPTTYTIDYGNSTRGQGKRVKGQVKGSMFDISLRGKKEYKRILGGLPEYEEIKDEFGSSLDGERMKVAYLKAREAGFNKEQSLCFAYTLDEPENLLYKQLKQAHNSKDVEDFKQAFYEALEEVMVENGWITLKDKVDDEGNPLRVYIPDYIPLGGAAIDFHHKMTNENNSEVVYEFKQTRAEISEDQKKTLKNTINNILNQYKIEPPLKGVNVCTIGGGCLGVAVVSKGTRTLSIDSKCFKENGINAFNKSVEAGWLARTDKDVVTSVLTHELGHTITASVKNETFWNKIQEIKTEYVKNVKENDIKNKDFISTYARKSKDEFVAECFAQATLLKSPSKYAKMVLDEINSHFKNKGNKTSNIFNEIMEALNMKNEKAEDDILWIEGNGIGYCLTEEDYNEREKEVKQHKKEEMDK